MTVWLVSREYAGIAEAGGVKNVACSLCESLAHHGHKVVLFIPYYGFTDFSHVECSSEKKENSTLITVLGREEKVNYLTGSMNGVDIVFVQHKAFTEKRAVYTYTQQDQAENPLHAKGQGHSDVNFMNVLFQKAVVVYARKCSFHEKPFVIHCQDAATAMVPVFADWYCRNDSDICNILGDTKFAVTIHNAGPGYHHSFSNIQEAMNFTGLPEEFLTGGLCKGTVEPFILASRNSCITTVSPEYAEEILCGKTDTAGLDEVFVKNKVNITGITNGMDFLRYDPEIKEESLLPFEYSPSKLELDGKYKNRKYFLENFASKESNVNSQDIEQIGYIDDEGDCDKFVFIAYHGRVVHQKGIEVMCRASELLLEKKYPVKFIFAGQGAPELEERLSWLTKKYNGSAVYLKGYDRVVARLAVAVSDFSLHPSYFEPCGLEDFIAQIFGTIPVAHATGGLQKIIDGKTGYLYSPNTEENLANLLVKLVDDVNKKGRKSLEPMIKFASDYILENYSWDKVAVEYEKLYLSL